jgi:hypothetical protein
LKQNRMNRTIILVTLLSITVEFLSVPGLHAQACKATQIAPPLAQTAEELRHQFGAVRFRREEQWEDRFVVKWSAATVALTPHIFQVQARRFEVSGDSLIAHTNSAIPTMYVSTSPDESRVYKLGGFDSPEQEFNRMVADGPTQKIGNEREAESRGLMCAEIVYSLSPEWWLGGATSAKLQAAKHFFDAGHEDGLRLAEKWWNSFKVDRRALNITTTKVNRIFLVNLPVFWASVEGHSVPEIRLYRIEISESGTCHINEPVIYR